MILVVKRCDLGELATLPPETRRRPPKPRPGRAGCAGLAGNAPGAPSQQAAAQDSPRTVAYKSLATMNKTYNATMKSLADLYRQKLIDEQVKAKAIEYGSAFQQAYNKALDAAENNDFSSISGVSVALANLLDFIQPYLVKGGKQ